MDKSLKIKKKRHESLKIGSGWEFTHRETNQQPGSSLGLLYTTWIRCWVTNVGAMTLDWGEGGCSQYVLHILILATGQRSVSIQVRTTGRPCQSHEFETPASFSWASFSWLYSRHECSFIQGYTCPLRGREPRLTVLGGSIQGQLPSIAVSLP